MRTTIEVDDDLLIRLDSMAQRAKKSRREVFNDLLRRGMEAFDQTRAATPIRPASRDLGRCLLSSFDDVADALAVAEGEDFH